MTNHPKGVTISQEYIAKSGSKFLSNDRHTFFFDANNNPIVDIVILNPFELVKNDRISVMGPPSPNKLSILPPENQNNGQNEMDFFNLDFDHNSVENNDNNFPFSQENFLGENFDLFDPHATNDNPTEQNFDLVGDTLIMQDDKDNLVVEGVSTLKGEDDDL